MYDGINCRPELWLFVVSLKKRKLSLHVYEKEVLKMFKMIIRELHRLEKNSY